MFQGSGAWVGSRICLERDSCSDIVCFEHRSQIFAQDDPQEWMYKVASGIVRLSKLLPDGRRQIVDFALGGRFLEPGLADAHLFNAEACCDVRLHRISREAFREKLADPDFADELMRSQSIEMALTQEHLVVLGRASPEEKLAWFIMHLWRRAPAEVGRVVPLHITRADIADYLGLTLETVCRIFTRFARAGVWRLDRNTVEIQNPGQLQAAMQNFSFAGTLATGN